MKRVFLSPAISRYRNLHAQLSPLFPRSGASTIDIQWAFSFCLPTRGPAAKRRGRVGKTWAESGAGIGSTDRLFPPPLRANRNRARINHFQCIRPSPRPVAFYIIYFLSFSSDVSRRRRRCLFYFSKIIESVCLYFSARYGICCWLSLVKSREGEE